MDALPDEHEQEDRREALERFADDQLEGTHSGKLRLHTRVLRRLIGPDRLRKSRFGMLRVTRLVDRVADRVRDRGLNTSGKVVLPEHSQEEDWVTYAPSSWHFLPRALRYTGVSDNDTFIDFGCGKGRVVHQAAGWPFRRVIGVEVSSELAEVAQAAVTAHRDRYRCQDVEIVVADVKDFVVPDDLTIGYLYRPVLDDTFDVLLRGIVESIDRNPRRLRLINADQVSGGPILGTGRFRLVKEQSSARYAHTDRVAIFESC